jgi:acyl carrier protein
MDWVSGKIATLVGLSIAAIALGYAVRSMRLKRTVQRTFAERAPLTASEFHQRYFARQGIEAETSAAVREVLQLKIGMDMSRLSGDDDFAGNLAFLLDAYDMLDVDIIVAIERRFGIDVSDEEAARTRTVQDLVMLVHAKLEAKSDG